ncbi:MAG: hypothetical protein ABF477_03575 [Leuconostoc pseudomesenteroides]|uniref:hypothetical protein n=1 Tax=Leuconostoc pseudomesenteroides TaxID=33968 RepID=UPI0039E8B6CB
MKNDKKIAKQKSKGVVKIPNVTVPKLDFTFRSQYHWLEHYEDGQRYSNHLKSAEEFSAKIKDLIENVIPEIYDHYTDIFEKRNGSKIGFKHTHLIDDASKSALVKKVAQAVTKQKFGDVDWWQIGKTQGVRIFGFYQSSNKTFYPVFIDWNHMIYPSEKHNNLDLKSLKYPD